ncbi:hypothetical protein M409DRAFT_71692 [Zasmidium cellare ATCC 36951]|uniref:Ras-domain-containing protein n=1 Tax=Zasmidium cellare ATCC 36951 TaxID=1080233 RepID=A0A6A6BV02_ZASCE|nr:uncharacterized protein M409DRAFT_71692 [Zasmidium cellare ATCC 36951]KAF2158333.1 hypothetical protein M409DRAFT_71692 [Zasmidium cellare ATCC 36951]
MSHGKMTSYSMVVLGDGGVGKTALTLQLVLKHFVETYDPTIEESYKTQVDIDGTSCMLDVLDTTGQKVSATLWDGICSRSSFIRIPEFHRQIQRVKADAAASPTPIPIVLVGNKCDRVIERQVSTQEGEALAKSLNCGFVEASARTGVNVDCAFHDVVRELQQQRLDAPLSSSEKTSKFDTTPPTKGNELPSDREEKSRYDPLGKRRERAGPCNCVIL